MLNKFYLSILFLLLSAIALAQKRSALVLIKQEMSDSYKCPDQQTEFKVHTLNQSLDYEKKKKVKEVFIERLKGSDEKAKIYDYEVKMNDDDFLIIYEYFYQYSENRYSECLTNERRLIKGFPISDLTMMEAKLQQKLANNPFKKKYIRHRILEIQLPFSKVDPGWLNSLTGEMKKLIDEYYNSSNDKTGNKTKPTGPGVRG
jgi:hypothetical protein